MNPAQPVTKYRIGAAPSLIHCCSAVNRRPKIPSSRRIDARAHRRLRHRAIIAIARGVARSTIAGSFLETTGGPRARMPGV